MQDYLGRAWNFIQTKLGTLASFIPSLAQTIHTKLSQGDFEGASRKLDEFDARLNEVDETTLAARAFSASARQAIADKKLTLAEDAELMKKLQRMLDEAEDIVTGVDEDDPSPGDG